MVRIFAIIFAIIVFNTVSLNLHADASVQIGSGLQVLTQIQGNWANNCCRAGLKSSEGFRQDFLTINYTHFEFLAKIYSDENCKRQVAQWPAKFRFTLGDTVLLPNQEKVILLNLVADSDPAKSWFLSPNNILQYKAGHLSLGRESLLGTSNNQIINLDLEQSYFRR